MKKIIFALALLSSTCAFAQDAISGAIKKSDLESLKTQLDQAQLSTEQVNNYTYLAKKIVKYREDKLHLPRKYNGAGDSEKLKAIIAMTLATLATCGVIESWTREGVDLTVLAIAAAVDYCAYKKSQDWWKKGDEIYQEATKNKRTPKQKYTDSIEIKQALEAKS